MHELLKYFPLVKIDEAAHMVWGIVTSEAPDHDKEICDYEFAKASIRKWSDEQLAKTTAAGQDASLGNMRVMHQLQVGGKAVKIEYHDDTKQVWVGSEPANDEVWHLLKGGFLTMHSIGGGYAWKKAEGEYTRYGPTIGEISYVDKGSNPEATFAYVKADGTTELRKFAPLGDTEKAILRKMQNSEFAKLSDGDVDRIAKSLALSLDTPLQKLSALAEEIMSQRNATGATMNPEQLKKCAAALGISEEEFGKQYVPADALAKAKKGLAALHEHISAAHEEHGNMTKAHEKLGTHLGKCMKACSAVMGSDEKEAEKALKALVDELKGTPADDEAAKAAAKAAADKAAADAAASTLTKAEVDRLVADAVEKAVKALPAPDPAGLRVVPRGGTEVAKTTAAQDTNASPF